MYYVLSTIFPAKETFIPEAIFDDPDSKTDEKSIESEAKAKESDDVMVQVREDFAIV